MSSAPDPYRISRRLKLRDLHILSTVVRCGSMAKAASLLAVTQPAVSESIANLEAALGVRLLDRSTRGVEPTPYAHAMLKRAQVAVDELTQAVREIEFMADPTVGEVRVACGDTLAAGLLPAVIDALCRRHPGIAVRVVQANAEGGEYRELRERSVDLALARVPAGAGEDDLDIECLFDDPHCVVAGARSPWARRRKIDLAELVDEPWIFPLNRVVREMVSEAFRARGLGFPRETVSGNSILLRNHLLATGRFLTVLPASVVRYNAKAWSLKALPIDLAVKPRSVAIVTLRNRTPGPVVRVFSETLRSVARGLPARWCM